MRTMVERQLRLQPREVIKRPDEEEHGREKNFLSGLETPVLFVNMLLRSKAVHGGGARFVGLFCGRWQWPAAQLGCPNAG